MSPPPTLKSLSLVVAAAALCPSPAQAFSVSPPLLATATAVTAATSTTQLHLVPEQGNQLAAAFNAAAAAAADGEADASRAAALEKVAEHKAHSPFGDASTTRITNTATVGDEGPITLLTRSTSTTMTATKKASAAKAFVSRIFGALPGAIMGRHPAAALVDIPREHLSSFLTSTENSDDDVVLYPLVGFRFVHTDDDDDSGGAVKVLPTASNPACRIMTVPDQELFGWYCTSCPLESVYSDAYCDDPKNANMIVTDMPNDGANLN